jgi:tripartite-type tricarboxylate transporter receptor subunit TctC
LVQLHAIPGGDQSNDIDIYRWTSCEEKFASAERNSGEEGMASLPSARRRAIICGLGAAAFAMATRTQAQIGGRPIKFIVPTSPGSSADIGARIVAERLQVVSGRSVITENKVGAGGSIAANFVALSEPNGETIGMLGNSYLYIPLDFPQQKFDPIHDLAPVAMIQRGTNVLVVGRDSRYQTLNDIVQRARLVPGQMTCASAGQGSSTYQSAERLRVAAGLDFIHVPYRGSPELVRDIIAGRVDFGFAPVSVVAGFMEGGLTRFLAVSTPPNAIQIDLNKMFNAVLDAPEVNQRFASLGGEAAPLDLEPLRSLVHEEYDNAMAFAASKPR